MEKNEETRVEFARARGLAGLALFAGVAIAIGVPMVVLGLPNDLTPQMQLWLLVVAIVFGGLVCLTAAFFGITTPSSVGGKWDSPCEPRGADESKTESPK